MPSPAWVAAATAAVLGALIAGDVVAIALESWPAQAALVSAFACVAAASAASTMWWGVTNREYPFVVRMSAIFTIPLTYVLFFAGLYALVRDVQPDAFETTERTWIDPLAGAIDGIAGNGLGVVVPKTWGAKLIVLCAQEGMSFFRMIVVPVALAAAIPENSRFPYIRPRP